jgi:NAD(P)-dependent dehydrogenase (short-subunit alcohol dehydrogenase family)
MAARDRTFAKEGPAMTQSNLPRHALVTGASAGLGAAIAQALSKRDWHVIGASRRGTVPPDGQSARSISGVSLDVTDSGAVKASFAEINAEGALDLLVANAGLNVPSPIEELPEETARAIMEVNFWGVTNCVRAALPAMRQRRRGTIAIIGSLAGRVTPPGEAIYGASKHAIEGWVEGLRHEVAQFGIDVVLFTPGFMRTDIAKGAAPVPNEGSAYGGLQAHLTGQWRKHIDNGLPAEAAARRIVARIERGRGPWRVPIGADAIWVPFLRRMLGERLFLSATRKRFGL